MSLRKALLVGINAYRSAPLRGCVNDVFQMKEVLQRYYGFAEADMRILLDRDATATGIKAGLEWLAQDGDDADAVRVFHYSGHGSFVADQNGDEPDGRDECLVPYDYESVGMLTDDVLKTYYDRFPRTGNLTLVMDSCHSGTVNRVAELDITFRFLPASLEERKRAEAAAERFAEEQEQYIAQTLLKLRGQEISDDEFTKRVRQAMLRFQKRRFGDIRMREANILLAGCQPDQQSADAYIGGDYHGAFTYYLVEAITQANGQLTYRQLAEQVGAKLGAGRFAQVPQLEYRGRRDRQLAFQPFTT